MVEPIAIIGSGCRFPGGADTPSKLWSVIHHPRDLSSKPPASRFDIDAFYHPVGTHHGTTNATKSYWLEESDTSNVAKFDAGFFNIQPSEVEAMDPQQRLLMEVVYDGLCAAGQPMEKLRGSDTAVYVGLMSDDWSTMLTRDWETLPRYTATGLERGIVANRVSYFFDWHGPSMTIDTACSSSLVALDLGVQALRSGKSKVAVAAGTNLILSPAMYISESNLGMLSPTGRCAMWDASADGYARGEGVAAVFLKTLSQAIADNDPIECIIRETAVNQDGRTTGLTMPSNLAQSNLIRECYSRAGLDPTNNLQDRPQFFHAHGTGTQAGDPQEAEAISSALFPAGSHAEKEADKLLVGSIKTVIGHTEGTAGLASVIGTMMALKHGIVPPNLHFANLSAKVAPFFKNLKIPTAPMPWPVKEGQVRRASVNSFGFGGTNAHCILEEYVPEKKPITSIFTPLPFSAASETALRTMLSQHLEYLKLNPTVEFSDLAYTLQHRRSTLPYRKAVVAATTQDAIESLEGIVNASSDNKDDIELGTRFGMVSTPAKILGIFTGQGAQWPRMGAQLIESSLFAASRISELDAALQSLPNLGDRPAWTLKDQLLVGKETSRIAEAALSQPLCTAVQVILVDILRGAGVSFTAVVGHSSGEIGAAYAAGLISAQDAIRIAYFRGVHAKLASSPNAHGPRGAMMAVGASVEDARVICSEENFVGRIQVAAVNSGSSVTLSGDEDAVDEAEALFKSQGIFARKLKVDTAYHSAHMAPCARPYLFSLEGCAIQSNPPRQDTTTIWHSTLNGGEPMTHDRLTNQYWVNNMCNAVLFADGVANAVQQIGTFDLAIEVGPHPALKGPATATIGSIPYTGLLSRGLDDIKQLSNALGFIWTQLGPESVRFSAVEGLLSGIESRKPLKDLPSYPFEHKRDYWTNSRLANHFKDKRAIHLPNPVLGAPCSEATTPGEFQWRNFLRPNDMPWLKGHRLQGQTVFPATGYVSMAVEAIKGLIFDSRHDNVISMIKLTDISIPRAIAFDDDDSNVETIFSVSSVHNSASIVTAEWACYSVVDGGNILLNAKGRVAGHLSPAKPDSLPLVKEQAFNLVGVRDEHFYANLSGVGYEYSHPFRGLSNIRRKSGYSVGTLFDQSGLEWDDKLVLHPGMLDSALQTVFAAWSYPGDTQLWSLHVPVSISAVTINPYFTALGAGGKQNVMQFETLMRSNQLSKVVGDIYLRTDDGSHAVLQFEGATLVPFSPATPKNDLPMFSHFQYRVASPDAQLAAEGETVTDFEIQMYKDVDRVSYWFTRHASLSIPSDDRHGLLPHFQKYLKWCDRMVGMVSRGENPKVGPECNDDSREDISRILARYEGRKDIRFVEVVGDNLIPVIRAGNSMLEHMNQDGLLRAFYEENAICAGPTSRWLARIVSQISHRFPGLNIFEIGAGTGATTSSVLRNLHGAYASYTFTDISSGFFMAAEERFAKESGRMTFKVFDMEKGPAGQGFIEGSYDLIVAVNVLHVSADMEASMSNIRRLLKPGGFIVVGELTSTDLLFSGMTVGTLPGWWIGAETGRPWGPLLTLDQWDSVLKKTGFAGIDTVTPNINSSLPISVFVGQAVNDQVTLLRNPLAVKEHPIGVRTDALAIIGGTTNPVQELGQEISDVLSHRFQDKEFFNTVEDFASSAMAKSVSVSGAVTILSLTDLDKPYLEDLTADRFEALKACFIAGTVVWVTCGSREDTPYSYMMMGLARTIKTENPNLSFQLFDLDSKASPGGIEPDTATIVAQELLRQRVLQSWDIDDESLLWTVEPEVFIHDGRQLITRLIPDLEKNMRYNSQRREVFTAAKPAEETLELVGVGRGQEEALELHKVSPLRLASIPSTAYRTVRITHSLLQSVVVGASGFFRLCVGIDIKSGEIVLALSSSGESPANIPEQSCILLSKMPDADTLVSVAAQLVAEYILSITPEGGFLLVNEADLALQSALQSKANNKNVSAIFTTAELQENNNGISVFLHPNFPQHVIKFIIPNTAAVFVHFSRGVASEAVKDAITPFLPPGCLMVNEEAVLGHKINAISIPELKMNLAQVLQNAWDDTRGTVSNKTKCIALGTAPSHRVVGEPMAVVEWTATASVMAKVQPIDSGVLFRDNRTYLFVGMAGELGQSLAGWLISHGARYVVLTSRTPKVSPAFIKDMAKRYGAVVKTMSLDITSRESLHYAHTAITATLPPIAGVMNGAMILEDELFSNMTHEQFARVIKPKVLGTQLLDERFHDDTSLDFFIVASSIASVIGWSGQSNYSAANEYMASLVYKRRNRGAAASAMSIPAVVGVGYAANSINFDFEYFQSVGYINISEEDLHTLFAEAVVSGRPGQAPGVKAQVAMGVNFLPSDFFVQEAHRRDIKFSHFILHEETGLDVQAVKAGVRVRVQLETAKNTEEAYTIIRDAFSAHLKRMLRMTDEQKIEDSIALVEQGVDSLVAVDIRSWFLKELEVDIPTLKILGGGSIADLAKAALDTMPSPKDDIAPASSELPPTHSTQPGRSKLTGAVQRAVLSSKDTASSSPLSAGSPIFTPAQGDTPSISDDDSISTPPPSQYYFGKKDTGKIVKTSL
ncbi:polyketide synthase [Arthroderma uncinatum]|uniref:polyketide synthase n=1 Tax=Arthroderma uncinatum TaxID=74035 RepID=UPI00144A7273|nr:polyketide synthase [Arthroderma uncinatum]KAF3484360.1 polyketide synthase [Arthroderma uncinatum]